MTGQRAQINQLVKIVDRPHVLDGLLNSFFKLALKIRTLLHWKKKKKIIRTTIKISLCTKKEGLKSKHTNMRGLPPAQQPRDIPPKVIGQSLPTIARNKEVSGLPITEGRGKINYKTGAPVPGNELIIPKFLRFF